MWLPRLTDRVTWRMNFPSNDINCMSVWEWSVWERECSETLDGLDLMLVLSTGRLCSLNLSLRQKWPNCVEDSVGVNILSEIKITIALIWLPVLVWSLLGLKILNLSQYLGNNLLTTKSPLRAKQIFIPSIIWNVTNSLNELWKSDMLSSFQNPQLRSVNPVSYTHLTLPTKRIV